MAVTNEDGRTKGRIYLIARNKDLPKNSEPIEEVSYVSKYLDLGRLIVINKAYEALYEGCESRGFSPSQIKITSERID